MAIVFTHESASLYFTSLSQYPNIRYLIASKSLWFIVAELLSHAKGITRIDLSGHCIIAAKPGMPCTYTLFPIYETQSWEAMFTEWDGMQF